VLQKNVFRFENLENKRYRKTVEIGYFIDSFLFEYELQAGFLRRMFFFKMKSCSET